jgi:hypothetical protein
MKMPTVVGELYIAAKAQFLIVARCPYCTRLHCHRAGLPGDPPSVGVRFASCDKRVKRLYVLTWKGARTREWPGVRPA